MQALKEVPAFLCFVPLYKNHHQYLHYANLLRINSFLQETKNTNGKNRQIAFRGQSSDQGANHDHNRYHGYSSNCGPNHSLY